MLRRLASGAFVVLISLGLVADAAGACQRRRPAPPPPPPPSFLDLSPEEKCKRVQAERVAYVGYWPMTCQDGPIRADGRMAECRCWPGLARESFRIVLRTDNLNPADPEGDLAYRMAHEFGHAWHATFRPREMTFDGTPAYASEEVADAFARRNVLPRPRG